MFVRVIALFVLFGCTQCQESNLSCERIRAFVDGHNNRRTQLADGTLDGQPAAADMTIIIWDEELAAKAAKWASGNKFQHNPDRTVDSGRFTTGENIFMFSTTASEHTFDVDMAMQSWFNEYKNYQYGPLTSVVLPNNVQVGHYTQMVWSKSVYLGCGLSSWAEDNGWHNDLVVCNYGPAGNVIGSAPYTSGQPSGMTCGVSDCSRKYGNSC